MRIFVVGMPGAGNLGDDLISIMLVQHIFERWPQAEIGVLCAGYSIPFIYPNADHVRFLPTPRRRSWDEYVGRIRAIHNFVRTSDMILIGGGGLFQDSHYRFTVHKWLQYALTSGPQGIPVATVGVGFGPLHHASSRWYLKQGLARLSTIQVRDEESANIVQSLGYSAQVAPDIVAGTSLMETPFDKVSMTDAAILGCSIRPWSGTNFVALVDLIASTAQANRLSVKLFVFEHVEPYNTSEYDFSVQICDALQEKGIDADISCYRTESIDEFAHAFGNVKTAIATRFHANILWQKLGIPVLPLAYAPKVARLYEERGGDAMSIHKIEGTYSPGMFQRIELTESYSLPTNGDLFRHASYNPSRVYALGQGVSLLEAGYGITQSIAWRLQRSG